MEVVDRTRVQFQFDALASRYRLLLAVLSARRRSPCRRSVHVVVHDGAERVPARLRPRPRHRGRFHTVPPDPFAVPTSRAATASVPGRGRVLHRGRDVVGRCVIVAATALAALNDDHLDEWHHRVAYLAHLPRQLELLEQAHVAVALERRVLVAEREQLRHTQRVVVTEQPGQLPVRLGQRLQLHIIL